MKINKLYIGILMFIILLGSYALAFGVSRPYMENDELYMMPGDTAELEFVVQNGGGATEDVNVKTIVLEGSEILEIREPKDIYTVPAGGRINVYAIVNIPDNTKIGAEHHVKLSFTTMSTAGPGAFGIGSGIQQNFDVVIGERPEPKEEKALPGPEEIAEKKEPITLYIIIPLIVLLIILIVVLVIKRRKASEQIENLR